MELRCGSRISAVAVLVALFALLAFRIPAPVDRMERQYSDMAASTEAPVVSRTAGRLSPLNVLTLPAYVAGNATPDFIDTELPRRVVSEEGAPYTLGDAIDALLQEERRKAANSTWNDTIGAVGRPPVRRLLFPKHWRTASSPAGRMVARMGGLGALYDSLPMATCDALMDALRVDEAHRRIEEKATLNVWRTGLTSARLWLGPWGDGNSIDYRNFCGKSGRRQGHPPSYMWAYYPRNTSKDSRYWILDNIAAYQGQFFADDSVLARWSGVCRAVKRAVVGSNVSSGMREACLNNIDILNGTGGMVLRFAGYFAFNTAEWPPVKRDSLVLQPLSSAPPELREARLMGQSIAAIAAELGQGLPVEGTTPPDRAVSPSALTALASLPAGSLVHAAASIWVPPVDLSFSYHFLSDWLLMAFHSIRHRVAAGHATAFYLSQPRTTRWGFGRHSCHYGAERCLDGSDGTATTKNESRSKSDWLEFVFWLAGGRGAMLGLDRDDLSGMRGFVTNTLFLGAPVHCEPGLGREAGLLAAVPSSMFTLSQVDCGRLYWEWRKSVARFLAWRAVRNGGPRPWLYLVPWLQSEPRARAVYYGAPVEPEDPAIIVFVTRRDAKHRRLIDMPTLIQALEARFRNRAVVVLGDASSLQRSFELFSMATVLIAVHGAALVNPMLMRPNAGLLVIDTKAPPMAVNLPPWVHFDAVIGECIDLAQRGNCWKKHAFHDLRLGTGGIRRVLAGVAAMLLAQKTEGRRMLIV